MKTREIYDICCKTKIMLVENEGKLENFYDKVNKDIFYQTPAKENETESNIAMRKYYETYEKVYGYVKDNLGAISYFSNTINNMDDLLNNRDSKRLCLMRDKFYTLMQEVDCAISLIDTLLVRRDKELGLEVKLPDLTDITELKKYIDGLEFVFTKCPFLQSDGASLRLEAVDNGSIWLIFGVSCVSVALGSALLNNIAAFIDKCFVIKSHSLSCKRQEQEIESAKIEQKEKEELLKSIHRMYKISVENAIRELQVSTGCSMQDGDEMGRAEQSFEKMTKLLDQGLQIHASLNSPQEVKALFEPLEMHYISTEKELKKLEKKSETDSE